MGEGPLAAQMHGLRCTDTDAQARGGSHLLSLSFRSLSAVWAWVMCVYFVCAQWRIQTSSTCALNISILIHPYQYPVSVSVSETLLNQYLSSFSNRQYSIHKWNIALCLSCSYLFHSFIQNHEFYYNRGGVKKII